MPGDSKNTALSNSRNIAETLVVDFSVSTTGAQRPDVTAVDRTG